MPRAIDDVGGVYGAPVLGGDVNIADMGRNVPGWYDLPEWQRTEMMRQAKVRLDKAREEEQKRQAHEDAERLSGMHAPRRQQAKDPNANPEHYKDLGLYPFQPSGPGQFQPSGPAPGAALRGAPRAIDTPADYVEDN